MKIHLNARTHNRQTVVKVKAKDKTVTTIDKKLSTTDAVKATVISRQTCINVVK